VGWLDVTDQWILAALTVQSLREAGATVNGDALVAQSNSETLRDQLLADEIDIFWDYLGTPAGYAAADLPAGATTIELHDQLVDMDKAAGLTWLEPVTFQHGEAMAMRAVEAERLDVRSIADIARIADQEPGAATVCYNAEADWRGIEATYGFEFFDQVFVTEPQAMYDELAAGTCTFAKVPDAVDPAMLDNDLVAIDDPQAYYANSTAAARMRLTDAEANPEIAEILDPIAGELDDATMAELVARVEVGGEDPSDVAHDWLVDQGFAAP
jgi:osmoprotectant transport system substrate-binding protein